MEYAELMAEAARRIGEPSIVQRAGLLLQMAEADLNKRLRVSQMEATDTLTPVDGVATLPDDFLRARSVTIGRVALESLPLNVLRREIYRTGYAIVGREIRLFNVGGDITLDYYARIPALTSANSTNWLSLAEPEIYLAAMQIQAALDLGQLEAAAVSEARLGGLIDALHREDADMRMGDTLLYVGGARP